MILTWGSFSFDDNEVWFEIDKKVVRSKIGRRMHERERWIIYGIRKGSDASEITTKNNALINALTDYHDLSFSGGGHSLTDASTISGTRVVDFRWLSGIEYGARGSGVECVLRRSYRLIIEGDRLASEHAIVDWHESVQTIGDGGPAFVLMGSLIGPVQLQHTQMITPFTAVQTGYAIGHLTYPSFPVPLWPTFEYHTRRIQRKVTPKFAVNQNTLYPIRWRYVFGSSSLLVGGPTTLP